VEEMREEERKEGGQGDGRRRKGEGGWEGR